MRNKRGQIVDYTVPEEMAESDTAVSKGDVVPMLIVSVNDDDSTESGIVFLTDGTTRYVHNVPENEPEPEPSPPVTQTEPAPSAPVTTVPGPETGPDGPTTTDPNAGSVSK